MTANPADAKEMSVDAALVADLSEMDGTFLLKEEQRMTVKAFFSLDNMFSLKLLTSFCKSFVKLCIVAMCG